MKILSRQNIIVPILIVILGFSIRVYNLAILPSGFFADEASVGYNAYSILVKGRDEYGTSFPLFFRAFGEYKNPIQIYTTVPFIALFGLNEFAVRLPSVMFGTLSIAGLYLLIKQLLEKRKAAFAIASFSSLFLAISPWHVHLSRVALEGQLAFVCFTVFATYFFLKARFYPRDLFLSMLFFTLALYSYFPARIFIPLFVLSLVIIYYRQLLQNTKTSLTVGTLFFLLLLPLSLHLLSKQGLSRWKQVSIFSNPPQNTTTIKHIVKNYISHFSLNFLFLKGDIDMPGQFITRHSIRGMGELYLFQFPLIMIAVFYLLKNKWGSVAPVLLVWLFLYPSGSMLTADSTVQATRSIIGVVPFQVLSGIGLFFLGKRFKKIDLGSSFLKLGFFRYFFPPILLTTLILFSFFRYLNLYFQEYNLYSSDFWGWQYGARDIVQFFDTHRIEYSDLVMAPEFNAPEIFFKFYAPNSCLKCRIGLPDNFYNPSRKQLFALSPTYLSNNQVLKFKIKKTIYYPNKTIAFQIGEIVQ